MFLSGVLYMNEADKFVDVLFSIKFDIGWQYKILFYYNIISGIAIGCALIPNNFNILKDKVSVRDHSREGRRRQGIKPCRN